MTLSEFGIQNLVTLKRIQAVLHNIKSSADIFSKHNVQRSPHLICVRKRTGGTKTRCKVIQLIISGPLFPPRLSCTRTNSRGSTFPPLWLIILLFHLFLGFNAFKGFPCTGINNGQLLNVGEGLLVQTNKTTTQNICFKAKILYYTFQT